MDEWEDALRQMMGLETRFRDRSQSASTIRRPSTRSTRRAVSAIQQTNQPINTVSKKKRKSKKFIVPSSVSNHCCISFIIFVARNQIKFHNNLQCLQKCSALSGNWRLKNQKTIIIKETLTNKIQKKQKNTYIHWKRKLILPCLDSWNSDGGRIRRRSPIHRHDHG